MSGNNLLVRLHKWAWRQDENFLTETLAHLLETLLGSEPEAAVRLVRLITADFICLRPEEARTLEIRTQVMSGEGTPDLQIQSARQLAMIEVKSESELATGQLARYRKILHASGYAETRLILLTRYPVTIPSDAAQPDVLLRWYQIAEWIDQERQRYPFKPVSSYVVEQFLEFLGAQNMVMGQVSWELAGGVRALHSLVNMLNEAATACGLRALISGGRDWMGVYLEGRRFWAGIYYNQPESLCFEAYNVDFEAGENLPTGDVYEEKGNHHWHRQLDLESEDVHFFARSKASQLQFLEAFLRESFDMVKPVLLPGDAVRPDEESDVEPPVA